MSFLQKIRLLALIVPPLNVLFVYNFIEVPINREGYSQLDRIRGYSVAILRMPGLPFNELIVCLDRIPEEQPGDLFGGNDLSIHTIHISIKTGLGVWERPEVKLFIHSSTSNISMKLVGSLRNSVSNT